MRIKSQIMNQNANQENMTDYAAKKEKQMTLLYETLQFYSHNKKKLLGETFEVIQLFEDKSKDHSQKKDDQNTDLSSCDGDADLSSASSDSNTSGSETASEYAFSDVDDDDTQNVNKLMAYAFITLRRARQSKIGLRINKKTLM